MIPSCFSRFFSTLCFVNKFLKQDITAVRLRMICKGWQAVTKHLQRRKYLQTERKNGLSQSHRKKRWLWLTRTFTRSRSVLNTTHNNSRIHSIHALKRLNVILCGSTTNVGAAASNMWRARGYPTISRFVLCNLTYFQSIREVLFRWCFLFSRRSCFWGYSRHLP